MSIVCPGLLVVVKDATIKRKLLRNLSSWQFFCVSDDNSLAVICSKCMPESVAPRE